MSHILRIVIINLIFICCIYGQNSNYTIVDSIMLYDKSFEIDSLEGSAWIDLGFWNTTPPDIHVNGEILHEVEIEAEHGSSFLGMVTRANETFEEFGQLLTQPLKKDKKYIIKLSVCHFPGFIATDYLGNESPFDQPIKIRLKAYKVDDIEISKKAVDALGPFLVKDSGIVDNTSWEEITIEISPEHDFDFIIIQAWWDVPIIFPYNGHLLIDYVTNIYEVSP